MFQVKKCSIPIQSLHFVRQMDKKMTRKLSLSEFFLCLSKRTIYNEREQIYISGRPGETKNTVPRLTYLDGSAWMISCYG